MIIQIKMMDDENNIIAQRTSYDFEGAEENLGKLERYMHLHEERSNEALEELGTIDGLSAEEQALAFRPEHAEVTH